MASWNRFGRKENACISSTEATAQLKYRHDLKDNEAEFDVGRKYRMRRADLNFWKIFRCKLF